MRQPILTLLYALLLKASSSRHSSRKGDKSDKNPPFSPNPNPTLIGKGDKSPRSVPQKGRHSRTNSAGEGSREGSREGSPRLRAVDKRRESSDGEGSSVPTRLTLILTLIGRQRLLCIHTRPPAPRLAGLQEKRQRFGLRPEYPSRLPVVSGEFGRPSRGPAGRVQPRRRRQGLRGRERGERGQ